jgi:hypothetical protein
VPNFAKEKERVTRKTSRANDEIYVSGGVGRNVNRTPREPVINKRRSIAHLDRHQPSFSSLYQLNQINDPRSSLYQRLHHHSYNMMSPGMRQYGMWHARSYESGIGELNFGAKASSFSHNTHHHLLLFFCIDSEFIESPYHIYGRLPTPSSRGSRNYIASNSRMYIGDWE